MARRSLAERVYRWLLRCYPGEFRDEYAQEMLLAFEERMALDRARGWGAVLHLWSQIVADSIVRAPGEHLDVLRQDVRYAARSLRRVPVFSLTAIVTLAIGIGASTTIFSVVHAVILRPLPFDRDGRVVRIWEDNTALLIRGFAVSVPNFVSWRERSRTLELAAWLYGSETIEGAGDPVRVSTIATSSDLFAILDVKPLAGRLFTADDEQLGASPVAIITEGLWKSHFGGERSTLGRTVTISGVSWTIVGVLPERELPIDGDFVTPLRIDLAKEDRTNHLAQVAGRLRPGVSFDAARSEMEAIARQLGAEYPTSNQGWGVLLEPASEWIVPAETRRGLYMVLGAVGCLVLIVCANIASLMLARATQRRREVALRMAIGASRRRLVRQVLTEGFLLTAVGGAIGVLLATWSVPILRSRLPDSIPRVEEIAVTPSVLLFCVTLAFVAALLFAIVPGLAGSRGAVAGTLKEGARGSTGGVQRWRQALAVGQVGVATVLLIVAALLVQSLQRLQQVELGFDPAGLTTASLGLPENRYRNAATSWAFYDELLRSVAASPGVQAAALTSGAPFSGGNTGTPVEAVGESRLNGQPLQADWRMVSPGYFDALRIPLVKGRVFTGMTAADERTMIVSAQMARQIWGEGDPIGRQLDVGPAGRFTIVGVVEDVRNIRLALEPRATMYISSARYIWPTMTIIVRSEASAQPAALIRSVVRRLDPQLAVYNIQKTEDRVSASAGQTRMYAWLVVLFAAAAALLAAVGIYGVLAYLVALRRQEIGIRMALGAARSTIAFMFAGRGLWLAVCGLAMGTAGAAALSRTIESVLFGTSPRDPWTFAAASALVASVIMLASYFPARRAARVDPLEAIRSE